MGSPNGSWERPVPSSGFEVVAGTSASKPTSILIVEDEALVASYIEEVLAESGFRVAGVAASGLEALSLAEETQPRLALVDIRLTGPIDGIELACVLRQKYGDPGDLPVRPRRPRDDPPRRHRRSRSACCRSRSARARCSTRSSAR